MEALLSDLEAAGFARTLRDGRWGYAAVNAAHILGIGMVVVSSLTINLRLAGLWRRTEFAMLYRPLSAMAIAGLLLAVTTGFLLFSVRAKDYAGLGVFQLKLVLIAGAVTLAVALHFGGRWRKLHPGSTAARLHALVSAALWLGALASGRLIAFAGH